MSWISWRLTQWFDTEKLRSQKIKFFSEKRAFYCQKEINLNYQGKSKVYFRNLLRHHRKYKFVNKEWE